MNYAHGPRVDEILAKFTSTNTVFYHGDAQNSTLALTDNTATVLERYRYEAFGLPSIYDSAFNLQPSTAYGNRMLFQGREWLAEVKLNDHRYRYYSPELQRWLSRDPIEEDGGFGLYLPFANSPQNNSDHLGQGPVGVAIVIGLGVAAAVIIYCTRPSPTPPPPPPKPPEEDHPNLDPNTRPGNIRPRPR